MLLQDLLECAMRLQKVSSRNKKIEIIASYLEQLTTSEALYGVHFISGKTRQGKLNIGWKHLSGLSSVVYRKGKPVSLTEVDTTLNAVKSARGKQKVKLLQPLFERMIPAERTYFVSLIIGEVHQGAGEGLVKTAIAHVCGLENDDIETMYLRNPDIGDLYTGLRKKGARMVIRTGITLFRPVKPMLAHVSESIDEVLQEYAETAVEYKLDGVRIQVHKDTDTVRIYSRNLKDMTRQFPDLVAVVQEFPVKKFILDGEAVGLDTKGRIIPFQRLAKRTTRKMKIQQVMQDIPVVPQFFDVLYLDGEDLTSQPYRERMQVLDDVIIDEQFRVKRTLLSDQRRASVFYKESVNAGNEGIVMKTIDSPYRPGKRGKLWFKIKHTDTIDCVILAAEWGYGRRTGWLSNLHLGVFDETRTKYLMVGKTFKGLTDEMLRWFTENLPRYQVHKDRWTVYVKPAVVVEIAYNGVQTSTKYDSGYSLRFARVKRIRHDKKPDQINSVLDMEPGARRTPVR